MSESQVISTGGGCQLTITALKRVVPYLVADRSERNRPPCIILRARHAVGKSQVVRQIARGIIRQPLIDFRAGQMQEGDIVGLPVVDGPYTTYRPAEAIYRACKEPVVLFFDEANRATREVQQGLFQAFLDYEINGNKFHPQTVVFAAVNEGPQYQVTRMDPALKDRMWYCDLEPTPEEFFAWAKLPRDELGGGFHPWILEFLQSHRMHLEIQNPPDPNGKYPSRRMWEKLNLAAKPLLDRLEEQEAKLDSHLWEDLFWVSQGFVGSGCAAAFRSFAQNNREVVSIDEILDGDFAQAVRKLSRMKNTAGKWISLSDKLIDAAVRRELTKDQAERVGKAIALIPAGDTRLRTWMEISQQVNAHPHVLSNVKHMHSTVKVALVDTLNSADGAVEAAQKLQEQRKKANQAEEREAAE